MTGNPAPLARVLESTGLPLVPSLGRVVQALAERRLAVLRADPGSGKSTLAPLALLDSPAFAGFRIIMLEPRRVAAAAVASRMADLLGEKVGERVGYSVRLERKVGPRTRIEVVTEGLLVRRLLADPGLEGVGAVIFDEFHERSVHADLALALCLDLRKLRSDLALLVMSATMDGERVASFLERADAEAPGSTVPVPLIDCPGRPYPVSVDYRPASGRRRVGDETADVVFRVLQETPSGDCLAFMPGRREIEDAVGALRRLLAEAGDRTTEAAALHGSLPLSLQRDLLRPRPAGAGRRVVFATNIAETSLTVPGVSIVVDTGLAKVQRFHTATGMDRLSLENASLHSCDQRAGRAGRLGPGRCVRLWPERDGRPLDAESEILRSDAAPLVLDCALWGVRRRTDLPWLDAPPAPAWESGRELLVELGAISGAGEPTDRGRRMASLGVHPRLAAVALEGEREGLLSLACAAAAVLSDRDGSGIRDDADLRRRLGVLRGADSAPAASAAAWRARVADLAADLSCRAGGPSGRFVFSWSAEAEASVGSLLLAGFPDRAAKRQESGTFRFPSGREARAAGALSGEAWIVAVDAEAGERSGTVRLAAPIGAEDAERVLSSAYPEAAVDRWRIDWEGLVPRATRVRSAGRLVLSERRSPAPAAECGRAFAELVSSKGLSILPWDDASGAPRSFLSRARFWAKATGEEELEQRLGDGALTAELDVWLVPFLRAESAAGKPILDGPALLDALKERCGWEASSRIERDAPERMETPAGTRRRLVYEGDSVALEARIQEVFGLSETPRVAGVPVLLRLLSPAERPLQTTADLSSFWRNTYPEVRKEMRGRYPRHYWPEDPLVAEPTSRPKPRGT